MSWRVALALALIPLVSPSCDGRWGSKAKGEASAAAPAIVLPDDPAIRYEGRFDLSENRVARFAWSATSFSFRFTGTSLGMLLEDTPLPDGTPDADWLAVSVDGRDLAPLGLSLGMRMYQVVRGLGDGVHDLVVSKRTEAEVGTVAFFGVALDPGARVLLSGPARQRRIEIVGDSISAGFGIEGANAKCPFSARTEDATQTYGVLAARARHADVSVIAWKGKGVLRNNDLENPTTLPMIYERTLPGDPGSRFVSTLEPDAVILNVGTNDFSSSAPPEGEFRYAYDGFVGRIRALHPGALIVLVLGPMLSDEPERMWRTTVKQTIESVIEERKSKGDARLELLELWSDPADGAGCQVHPNLATHRKMAGSLVRLLESRLGWAAHETNGTDQASIEERPRSGEPVTRR
jgi:lysophospholipase L1-like esterase